MSATPVTFYSEGFRLVGDLYTPGGLRPDEPRAGIVLCHGYTGVKDLYLPDNARVLTEAGYVVLAFDYKGLGRERGAAHPPRSLQPGRGRAGRPHLPRGAGGGGRAAARHLRHELRRGDGGVGRRGRTGGSGAS